MSVERSRRLAREKARVAFEGARAERDAARAELEALRRRRAARDVEESEDSPGSAAATAVGRLRAQAAERAARREEAARLDDAARAARDLVEAAEAHLERRREALAQATAELEAVRARRTR